MDKNHSLRGIQTIPPGDDREFEGYDDDGHKISVRAREELAIAFQHEIDHLDGILFYDRIDPKKPFYNDNEIRLI